MRRGNFNIQTRTLQSIIGEDVLPTMKKERKKRKERKTNKKERERKGGIFCWARYLPSIQKGVVRSRWSVDVIIVTTVIAMTKGNERKGVQGYVSGFFFSEKPQSKPQPLP